MHAPSAEQHAVSECVYAKPEITLSPVYILKVPVFMAHISETRENIFPSDDRQYQSDIWTT